MQSHKENNELSGQKLDMVTGGTSINDNRNGFGTFTPTCPKCGLSNTFHNELFNDDGGQLVYSSFVCLNCHSEF